MALSQPPPAPCTWYQTVTVGLLGTGGVLALAGQSSQEILSLSCSTFESIQIAVCYSVWKLHRSDGQKLSHTHMKLIITTFIISYSCISIILQLRQCLPYYNVPKNAVVAHDYIKSSFIL